MARSVARQAAMQMLYEQMSGGEADEDSLSLAYEQLASDGGRVTLTADDQAYISDVLKGVGEHRQELDELIEAHSSGDWSLDRVAYVDRSILRLSVYELCYRSDVPANVSVSEAMELADKYSEPKSGRYINGVLGAIAREKAEGLTAMKVAIGFDTSCYTTSIAAVDAQGTVVASERMLLPVENGQRGLRQSEAVFAHVRQMPLVAEKLGAAIGKAGVIAVAASRAPRSQPGSYMPVFTVGEGHARTLGSLLAAPVYTFSHQQGHIAAGQLAGEPMPKRFVALHLSGGTTELLLWDDGDILLLGSSLDLHAGQLIDRVGVKLGLPFPAGPALEALAMQNTAAVEALLPACMEQSDLSCHLSGAEAQCERWIAQSRYPGRKIAAEVFDLLARTVSRMLVAACRETGAMQALVVGGVASSTLLRSLLQKRVARMDNTVSLRFGKPEYSGDNAAGIAWLGMQQAMAAKQ